MPGLGPVASQQSGKTWVDWAEVGVCATVPACQDNFFPSMVGNGGGADGSKVAVLTRI